MDSKDSLHGCVFSGFMEAVRDPVSTLSLTPSTPLGIPPGLLPNDTAVKPG